MSKPARQIRLGAFLPATGHHVAAWLHPGSQADAGLNLGHYKHLAQEAERGKFDMVFVADSPGGYGNPHDIEVFSRDGKTAHFEPVTLWSALSQVTDRIGFVATSTTTYEDPYTTARKFASLDWISGGRAAWNVVTTGADVSPNFSLPTHLEHSRRYERAEEYIDVVKGLWDSYEDDAFVRDRASGTYLDLAKLHLLNHKGAHFQVRGHRTVVGTPDQIAEAIQDWFEHGAADGFNIMPPVLPTALTDFVDQVVPILQRRGLFRTDYEGATLRENLGLERPANSLAHKAGRNAAPSADLAHAVFG